MNFIIHHRSLVSEFGRRSCPPQFITEAALYAVREGGSYRRATCKNSESISGSLILNLNLLVLHFEHGASKMMDSVAKPEEMIEGLGRLCNCIWRLVICGGHPIDPPIDGWPAVGMPALLRPTYRCIPATNMPNPRPQVLTSPSKALRWPMSFKLTLRK